MDEQQKAAVVVLALVFTLMIGMLIYALWRNAPKAVRPFPPDTFLVSLKPEQISIINSSAQTYYNCRFGLQTKGDRKAYTAFFRTYLLNSCTQLGFLQRLIDCTIENAVDKTKFHSAATLLEPLEPQKDTLLSYTSFWHKETRDNTRFRLEPQDIYQFSLTCQDTGGNFLSQTFTFP